MNYRIAEIKFEADIEMHPQAKAEYFDFKASKWNKNGIIYVKDEDVVKYTLKKACKNLFVLIVEGLDLFGIDVGKWNEHEHPEWESIINQSLEEIKNGLKTNIKIIEVKREIIKQNA